MNAVAVPVESLSTRDTLWGGRLVLWQPARGCGYRFNLDPVLLANFATAGEHVLDVGAGCGVVGLIMLALGKVRRVTAVEIQPHLAELAQRNAHENGLSRHYEVVCGDLRTMQLPRVDRVVFNPPYFPLSSSRASPDLGRDWARRENNGTLSDFARLSLGQLTPGGSAAAIVPMPRGDELATHWCDAQASVVRRRGVYPRPGAELQHELLEAAPVPQEKTAWESPLFVHTHEGRTFTSEVQAWVQGPERLFAR